MSATEAAYRRGVRLIDYGREIEEEIEALQAAIEAHPVLGRKYAARWLAIALLENDEILLDRVRQTPGSEPVLEQLNRSLARLRRIYGTDADVITADRRYGFIHGLVKEIVTRPPADRITLSDRIDSIVADRILGIPFFLAAMWVVFQVTANVSAPYVDWIDSVISGPVTRWIGAILSGLGLGGTWVESLLIDGVVGGVGGVLTFVPVLLFLYFFIAVLEDSGYMARAAFVMDRFMHALGLHGKSFLSLLVGLGCNVPGIYATRTLENERDRILTGLLVPMMSCAARLPVYAVIGSAMFGARSGALIFSMYILGIVMAAVTGIVLQRTIFKSQKLSPFVLELPPYRLPSWRGILIHMWERTAGFVRKAWTIILAVSVVIWALMNLPTGVENPQDSLFGRVSAAIAPAFSPAGFGDWRAAGALISGFVAKEIVVGTLNVVYLGADQIGGGGGEMEGPPPTLADGLKEIATGFWDATVDTVKAAISIIPGIDLMGGGGAGEVDTELGRALRGTFTPLSAVAFTVFVLLYTPCVVTVAAMLQEYGWKWAAFSAIYQLVLAWLIAVIVYQIGILLGFG